MTEEPEVLFFKCSCGKDVETKWVKGGMLSDPNVVLAGDVVFHAACWDKLVEENPP